MASERKASQAELLSVEFDGELRAVGLVAIGPASFEIEIRASGDD